MTRAEPLARHLGMAERTMQALLQAQLRRAGIGFPEWAVLTWLRQGEPMHPSQLGEAIGKGRLAEPDAIEGLLQRMIHAGLIDRTDAGLTMSAAARILYEPLRARVAEITDRLEQGIPEDDLAATRRTLKAVAERAGRMLAGATGPA